jgi:hypothetical protein
MVFPSIMHNRMNARYWELVQRVMIETGQPQRQAQLILLERTVLRALKAGHTHPTIYRRLWEQWRLYQSTYVRQLQRIRKTRCVP